MQTIRAVGTDVERVDIKTKSCGKRHEDLRTQTWHEKCGHRHDMKCCRHRHETKSVDTTRRVWIQTSRVCTRIWRALVSWCFKSSRPRRIIPGLKVDLIYLHLLRSTSHITTCLSFSNHNSNSIQDFRTQTQKNKTHVLELIYIPRTLSTGTCIQQSDLSYSKGLYRNQC